MALDVPKHLVWKYTLLNLFSGKRKHKKNLNNVHIYICNIICDIISDIYVNIPCWMHLNIFKSPSNVSASVKPSQRNVPLGFIVLQWWVWEDPNEKNRSRFTMASIGYSMLIRLWDTRRLFEESHPDWNHYPSGFFSSHGIIMKSILRKSHEITGYNWHSKDSLAKPAHCASLDIHRRQELRPGVDQILMIPDVFTKVNCWNIR